MKVVVVICFSPTDNFISPVSAVKRSVSFSRNVFKRCGRPSEIEYFLSFTQKNNHCKESKTSLHRRNISRISRHCPSVISNHVQTFTTIFFLSFSRWLQASSKQESGLSLIEPGVSLRGEVRCPTNFFGWKKLAISAKNIPRRKQYGSQLKTKTYQFRFAE